MKRLFILALVILLVGTVVGEWIVKDPGYVLLSYDQTTIETSIWGLALVVLFSFLALHLILRSVTYLLQRGGRFKSWNLTRGRSSANRRTQKGLLALASGDWSRAQRLLSQAADKSALPLVNYLAAARAAQEQHLPEACDKLLQQAREANPRAELAVGIVQAQSQLDRGQLESALATLVRLRKLAPRHTLVLKLLKETYVRLEEWEGVTQLLADLRRQQVYRDGELQQLEQQAYAGLLQSALTQQPAESSLRDRVGSLRKRWKALPKHLLNDERLIGCFAGLLDQAGAQDEAEAFLRDSLRKNWSSALVRQYGHLEGSNLEKQSRQALQWLKLHGNDASLLLTLGRLSMRDQNWPLAREYFERSLKLERSPETSNELIRLLRHLDDREGYQRLLEESLEYVTGDLPSLPLPAQPPAEAPMEAAEAPTDAAEPSEATPTETRDSGRAGVA